MREPHNTRTMVMLAAVLHVSAAYADDPPEPSPTTGKSVEDIINEARERVEGQSWVRPDWRQREREEKQRKKAETPRSWYFGIGWERTGASLAELYRTQAEQRDSKPLQYLEPLRQAPPQKSTGAALAIGFELTRWLDIELVAHDLESFWQAGHAADVFDPTLAGTAQDTEVHQLSSFDAAVYSLSLLPRWEISDRVAIYGRVGVGYADTRLASDLWSKGWVAATETCNVENGQTKCTTSRTYETRAWGSVDESRNGFIPVLGIGIQLFKFMRLEYNIRKDVPIGNATTDFTADFYLALRAKTAWL